MAHNAQRLPSPYQRLHLDKHGSLRAGGVPSAMHSRRFHSRSIPQQPSATNRTHATASLSASMNGSWEYRKRERCGPPRDDHAAIDCALPILSNLDDEWTAACISTDLVRSAQGGRRSRRHDALTSPCMPQQAPATNRSHTTLP